MKRNWKSELLVIKQIIVEKYTYEFGFDVTEQKSFDVLKLMHLQSLEYFIKLCEEIESGDIYTENQSIELEKIIEKELTDFYKLLKGFV